LLHEWLALHELGDLLVEVHIALLLRNRTTMKPIHTFSGETHFGTHLCRYWCFIEKRKRRGREICANTGVSERKEKEEEEKRKRDGEENGWVTTVECVK
jgi:hypothetical protein